MIACSVPRSSVEKPSPPVSTLPVTYTAMTVNQPYQDIRSKISMVLATQNVAG